METSITGLEETIKALSKAESYLAKKVPYTEQTSLNKMIVKARGNHKFTSRSGNLERSIDGEVVAKEWSFSFFIDPDIVTNKGYNYGLIQHDGSMSNYRKSKFSPTVTPKNKNGGVTADHFMVRAWDSEIDSLVTDLTKIISKAIK